MSNTGKAMRAALALGVVDAALASSAAAPDQFDDAPDGYVPAQAMWAILNACGVDTGTRRLVRAGVDRYFERKAQPAPAAEAWQPEGRNDGMRFPEESDTMGGETDCARPSATLSEGSHRIDGLGRMTDDDDGFVTLQFVSEAAAEAFMARYEPTVDVDAMPSPSPQPTKEAMADLIRTAGHVTRSHAKMIADVLHAALSSPDPVAEPTVEGLMREAVWAAIREWNGSNHKLTLSESQYLAEHVQGSLGVAINEAPTAAVKHLRVRWEDALAHTRAALSSTASSAGVDAQRLDAERYRWLRREVHGPRLPLAQVVWKQDGIRASSQWTNLFDGSSLDEHIDAAIAAKEQP